MKQRNTGIDRPVKTRAVFNNLSESKRAPKKQRKPAAARPVKLAPKLRRVKNGPRPALSNKSYVSPASINALHLAMSRFCPNNYPGAVPAGPDNVAPVSTNTTRWRSGFVTLSDGAGAYTQVLSLGNAPNDILRYGNTFASGAITVESVADPPNYAALATNFASVKLVSAEVVCRVTSASSSIGGSWSTVNIPNANSLVGFGKNTAPAYSQATVGTLTDASPSFRGIYLPIDEGDDAYVSPTANPAMGSGSLIMTISTPTAITFDAEIILNWACVPTAAGSTIVQSASVLVDDGAYARAYDSLASNVTQHSEQVFDPVLADQSHKGWLRKAAEFVGGTASDAVALVKAVQGAITTGSAIVGGAAALFGDPRVDMLMRALAACVKSRDAVYRLLDGHVPVEFLTHLKAVLDFEPRVTACHRRPRMIFRGAVESKDDGSFVDVPRMSARTRENTPDNGSFASALSRYHRLTGKPLTVAHSIPLSVQEAFLHHLKDSEFDGDWASVARSAWTLVAGQPNVKGSG